MNKMDLINSIAVNSGLNKKNSESVLNAFMSTVEETLSARDKLTLIGFGTFEVKERAERKGRNPQTKEEITIPATLAPVFKPGKNLKEMVNGK
ncbi:MAG: HU family DNA-binding protein [Clostridiales bacterium]